MLQRVRLGCPRCCQNRTLKVRSASASLGSERTLFVVEGSCELMRSVDTSVTRPRSSTTDRRTSKTDLARKRPMPLFQHSALTLWATLPALAP